MAYDRLKKFGFTSIKRNGLLEGVQVNVTATNKRGVRMYFPVAASWVGKVPGLKRTDTFKKAVCDCLMIYLNTKTPGIIITSDKPEGDRGMEIWRMLPRSIMLDIIDLEGDDEMWEFFANATVDDLTDLIRTPRDFSSLQPDQQLSLGIL